MIPHRKILLYKVKFSCGVSINNLSLNENDIGDFRTFLKLSPPLRTEDDRLSLVQGLNDDTIDVIVSDHKPEDEEQKRLTFAQAWANVNLFCSSSSGLWSETITSIVSSFNPCTKLNLSSSVLSGGDNFKKVLKSPISFSFKDKLFIDTPQENFTL